ncbi:hypothetical protein NB689_002772 [Xanthomonas sacchari]|nr:hypothetical protein [Xanthomonas sacchari]
MPAPAGDFQPREVRQAPAAEVVQGNHRVVLGHQDVGRHAQALQALAGDAVAVEVGVQAGEAGMALGQPGHQPAHVQRQGGVVVAVAVGEQFALAQQRLAPLAAEIPVVELRAVLDPLHGGGRVQQRAHRGHVLQRQARRRRAQRQAQGEVAAQRVAGGEQGRRREAPPQVAGGVDHFVQALGVEQVHVEVVGAAVVAEVEPEHLVAQRQHLRRGQAHVAGVGAAFPAVQQQHGAARRFAGRHAEPALQAHAIAAVEDVRGGGGAAGGEQLFATAHAQQAGTQYRLDVRVAQPARGGVIGRVHGQRACACRLE